VSKPPAESRAILATDSDLDRLFRSEGPRLLSFFRGRTRNADAASDMVQDAFVRLASRSGQGGLSNPAAYLQRIARNMLIDRKRRTAPVELPIEEQDLAVPPRQEEGLAARDLLRLYEEAVAGLSDKTRTVFLLQRVEGLTYEQIRTRLGISIATVEYHMMRAIAHIDRMLDDR
jgi:RNA polymerase sigma-70 factor (ECF subfamily)